jgi:hypothetical protein
MVFGRERPFPHRNHDPGGARITLNAISQIFSFLLYRLCTARRIQSVQEPF